MFSNLSDIINIIAYDYHKVEKHNRRPESMLRSAQKKSCALIDSVVAGHRKGVILALLS